MSTRSNVGAYTEPKQQGLAMTYCHYDGYPEGVGQTIYENLIKWNWDFKRMADFLNSPKVGWSSLSGSDFDLTPGWNAAGNAPHWYDDRESEHPQEKYTTLPTRASDVWIEYCYVIDPFTERLLVYCMWDERSIWLEKGDSYAKVIAFFDADENSD